MAALNKPYNNPFILAIKAYNLTVEIHHHSAYQIVLSNDNAFTSTIDGDGHDRIYGFLIKPQVNHFCKAENGTLSVVNIEPYSNTGLQLATRFNESDNYIVFNSREEINQFFSSKTETGIDKIIQNLFSEATEIQYDPRITTIVNHIRENFFRQDLTPQTFADLVFLSPSRLATLFKNQTGSSLSKYLLWTRLREAAYLTLSDKNRTLTDIAYDTGFYDLPQMNKYMYEMFGMPPKALRQNSDLIQVY